MWSSSFTPTEVRCNYLYCKYFKWLLGDTILIMSCRKGALHYAWLFSGRVSFQITIFLTWIAFTHPNKGSIKTLLSL